MSKPTNEEARARVELWNAGAYPEGTPLPEALGWTLGEYAAWVADAQAIPGRPLPELPVPPDPMPILPGMALVFTYRNWRGRVAQRSAIVRAIEWGATSWHPKPGPLMRALDVQTGEMRLFAMGDMSRVTRA